MEPEKTMPSVPHPSPTVPEVLAQPPARLRSTGFTLVELMIVVVLIGVLATFAWQRTVALQADARLAKIDTAVGATRAAAVMGRALLLARGYPDSYTGIPDNPPIVVEGLRLEFVNGYPAATVIAELAGLLGGPGGPSDYVVQPAAGGVRTVLASAAYPGCRFSYTDAQPGQQPALTVHATRVNCG
jgi:MSHA pilin protein MshA